MLLSEIENGIQAGNRIMSQSLAVMYNLASTYKIVSSTGQIVSATVFKTQVGSKEQPKQPQQSKNRDQSSQPPSPCKHCGGNHWNSQCPNKPSKASQASDTAGHGIARLTFSRTTLGCNGVVLHTHLIDDDKVIDVIDSLDYTVSIDTSANISCFNNERMLTNLRQSAPFVAEGINRRGDALTCCHVGEFGPLKKTVFYSPEAAGNILCFYDVAEDCDVYWDKASHTITATHPEINIPIPFQASNNSFDSIRKIYLCDMSTYFSGPHRGDQKHCCRSRNALHSSRS